MAGKPPVTAGQLKTRVYLYRNIGTERDSNGIEKLIWKCIKSFKVFIRKQYTGERTEAKTNQPTFKAVLLARWNDVKDITFEDKFYTSDNQHWLVDGYPMNWNGSNRWGEVTVSAIYNCDVDICNCGTDGQRHQCKSSKLNEGCEC